MKLPSDVVDICPPEPFSVEGPRHRNDRSSGRTGVDPRTRDALPGDLLADVYDAIDEGDGFGRALLDVVDRLVPSDVATFNRTDLGAGRTEFDTHPAPHAVHRDANDHFVRLHDEHPLIRRFARIDAPPPMRWRDVVDPEAFERTELFDVYYRPMGVTHQVAVKVAGQGAAMTTIALSRSHRPFTDDERDRLAVVLPHLRRSARVHQTLGDGLPSADALIDAGLTSRQAEVALALSGGGTNPELARRLGISLGTLRKHLERISSTLDVDNRGAAIAAIRSLRQP